MSKVLIATDGSEVSEYMVEFALDFASALEFEVFVVYVSDEPIDEGNHDLSVGEQAVKYAVEEAIKRGIAVESEVIHGIPAVDIVRKSNEVGAKAIIMGSVGRTGLSRLLVGSVAERVIKLAYGPVIVVRKPEHGNGGMKFQSMLIATDGSEANKPAIRSGLRLASNLSMKVSTISVNDKRDIPHANFSEAREALNEASKNAVADVIHQGHQLGLNVDPIIVDGVPHKEITHRSSDFDIVVIGSLGRSGIIPGRVGSVAEKVVRYAKCPVMVVRSTETFAPLGPF